jgi:hypothetical protein
MVNTFKAQLLTFADGYVGMQRGDGTYEVFLTDVNGKLIGNKRMKRLNLHASVSFTTNPKRSSSVFERLCAKNFVVNPKKTKLGLPEVEYVRHLVFATGTSFTPEKRLKVLDFPQSTTQKEMPQFIGLANFFRDHMNEMVKPLRDMIPLGKHQRIGKFIWTTGSSAAFKLCQQAISNS